MRSIITERLGKSDERIDQPVFRKGSPKGGRPILKQVKRETPHLDEDLDIPTFIRKHAD